MGRDVFSGLLAMMIVAASPTAAIAADGKNRKVTVKNESSQSIHQLYASPITSTTWEEDLLASKTIPSGTSTVANIDNGTEECKYDLKAVLADGKEWVHREVNVCAVSNWVITDSGEGIK